MWSLEADSATTAWLCLNVEITPANATAVPTAENDCRINQAGDIAGFPDITENGLYELPLSQYIYGLAFSLRRTSSLCNASNGVVSVAHYQRSHESPCRGYCLTGLSRSCNSVRVMRE
jgi:hypothetical protein